MFDFDVVVVGGGCAGLWASRTASKEGARTLLVERNRRIGERVICAEGVGAAGIGRLVDPAPEWVAASIDRAVLYDPDGGCVTLEEPGCGYVLNKDVFLGSLAASAEAAASEIRLGTEAEMVRPVESGGLVIDLKTPGGKSTVTAGAVVAADGIASGIARRLGIQRPLTALELFTCAQYKVGPVDLDPCAVEFHFGHGVAPGGYGWVFPKGQDVANVGVGMICRGKGMGSPVEYLERFRQERCPGARVLNRVVGGVPAARAPFRGFGQGVFVTGDAARVADPVSGAGIVPGMESAELAARAAAAVACGGSSKRSAERTFTKGMRTIFKDRRLRFAVRKVLSRMNDVEIGRMLELVGEYSSQTGLLGGDPFTLVRLMLKAMPQTFRIVRHLVRT